MEPRFVEWRQACAGAMPVDHWIWSLNVERRHLTPDQIAWATVQRRAWQETQAAMARQIEARKRRKPTVVLPPVLPLAGTGQFLRL